MTGQQLVSQEELVAILNRVLATCPECPGVEVSSPPLRLLEPDEEGCNWDRESIGLIGPSERVQSCRAAAWALLWNVGRQYNLR